MDTPTAAALEAFRTQALAAGFDEVLERVWPSGTVVDTHTHPFDADAIVTQGEMWLSRDGHTDHLGPGGRFQLACGTPHAERYGPDGATYWVARRAPKQAPADTHREPKAAMRSR